MHVAPTFIVEPAQALIDVPRTLRLAHFAPGDEIEVEARFTRFDQTEWRSHARFKADAQGEIDLATQAPLAGSSYDRADAGGLLWSLALQSGTEAPRADERALDRVIHLTARSRPGHEAQATLTQIMVADGVVREDVRDDGLSGVLYRAPGMGPHPAVIVLNGSGGGINEARAALFAAHGYDALALGYFLAPGRPDYISATPIEYFEEALSWVHRTLAPRDGFVALCGHSRGAELSLLLGSLYPQHVAAVIAYVPSSVIHGTLRAGHPGERPDAPAWILNGTPMTTVWENNRRADWSAFQSKVSPVRQSPSFETALLDDEAVARAAIPVERINGPILLISGTDDGFWPSTDMSAQMLARLKAANHAHHSEQLNYQGAGHALGIPNLPSTRIVRAHAVAGVELTGGGDAHANAQANADSWPRVLRFLDEAVRVR